MATILTVDDSPSIRQMIKVVLAPLGHTVVEAGDGGGASLYAAGQRRHLFASEGYRRTARFAVALAAA